MSKKREYIEEQKGTINMEAQYTQKFCREPEKTIRDISENIMRQDMRTLTLHEPKR
jgi:hypothetical protein